MVYIYIYMNGMNGIYIYIYIYSEFSHEWHGDFSIVFCMFTRGYSILVGGLEHEWIIVPLILGIS